MLINIYGKFLMKPKFIDLFAGIGGFRKGFEDAGYTCVFTSEINDKCQDVYVKNFKSEVFGDITKINPKNIPDFDVLLAGFPCQPFSISGKKKGFGDTRGTLFFDICKIIDEKKPKVVVLENVKHLIHHDEKKTFKTIIGTLGDLGYLVSYKILNSKDFGLPQNRERIFIVATKNLSFSFEVMKKQRQVALIDFLDKDVDFEYLDESEYTLIDNPKQQKSGLIFIGYRNKKIRTTGVRPNTEHLSRVHKQPNRIYSVDGTHPTLTSTETAGRFFVYLPKQDKVRKLTLNECYRIMGFPDDFKRDSGTGEQYKQIGNSVSIPVVYALAKELKKQGFFKNELQY